MSIALALVVACSSNVTPAPPTPPAAERAPEPARDPAHPAPEPAPPVVDKGTDISGLTEEERQAFLMALGERVYTDGDGGIACVTCHQLDGEGVRGAFPPLVGQEEWMGDCVTSASLVLDGMTGEIEVAGMKYSGVMVGQAAMLNDLQVAAVISYVRQSWGNDYGFCGPEHVATARTE